MNEPQQDSSDSITEKNVRKIKEKTGEKLIEEMLKLNPEKFTGLGRPEPPYHMQLLVDSTPVIHQPRKIPVAIISRLKKLEEIENTGIIQKVYDPLE